MLFVISTNLLKSRFPQFTQSIKKEVSTVSTVYKKTVFRYYKKEVFLHYKKRTLTRYWRVFRSTLKREIFTDYKKRVSIWYWVVFRHYKKRFLATIKKGFCFWVSAAYRVGRFKTENLFDSRLMEHIQNKLNSALTHKIK